MTRHRSDPSLDELDGIVNQIIKLAADLPPLPGRGASVSAPAGPSTPPGTSPLPRLASAPGVPPAPRSKLAAPSQAASPGGSSVTPAHGAALAAGDERGAS